MKKQIEDTFEPEDFDALRGITREEGLELHKDFVEALKNGELDEDEQANNKQIEKQ
jgi:hypothetical protein